MTADDLAGDVNDLKDATCLLEMAFVNLGGLKNSGAELVKDQHIPIEDGYVVKLLTEDQLDALGHAVYHVGDLARALAKKYGGGKPADAEDAS